MIAIMKLSEISRWIKPYILLKIKRFMVLKMKILKICMLSHLYKLLGNPCQVIIKAMLPCAECQNVTLFVVRKSLNISKL